MMLFMVLYLMLFSVLCANKRISQITSILYMLSIMAFVLSIYIVEK